MFFTRFKVIIFLYAVMALVRPAVQAVGEEALLKTAISGKQNATSPKDPLMQGLLTWIMLQKNPQDIALEDKLGFWQKYPGWPKRADLQVHIEQLLSNDSAALALEKVYAFFKGSPPRTAQGAIVYLRVLKALNRPRELASFVRAFWQDRAMTPEDERLFLHEARAHIGTQDHLKRMKTMIFAENPAGARRAANLLTGYERRVGEVVADCLENKSHIRRQFMLLSAPLRRDERVLWGRLKWLCKQKDFEGFTKAFLRLPRRLQYPIIFHKFRVLAARELLEQGRYKAAAEVLKNHQVMPGNAGVYADLEWHLGWVLLSYNNRPRAAREHFRNLLKVAKTPISLSRGYYWLGRAEEALGHKISARTAYQKAAAHKLAFYGQMAAYKLGIVLTPQLQKSPRATSAEARAFQRRPFVKIVHLLKPLGPAAEDYVEAFLQVLAAQVNTRAEKKLLVQLAADTHPSAAVAIARSFWVKDPKFPALQAAYPLLKVPTRHRDEKAAALAIGYKETRLNPTLTGDAGERGIMQVMPDTARMEARTLGLRYDPEKLFEPHYNKRLALAHLRRHAREFSYYTLAVLAYNAGNVAVARWLKTIGHPDKCVFGKKFHKPHDRMIEWLESVPYAYTRDYGQRFWETFNIYRSRVGVPQKQVQREILFLPHKVSLAHR